MTRGLYPPDTLSKDDIYTLNQVRKDLWYNAFIGGGELRLQVYSVFPVHFNFLFNTHLRDTMFN